MQGWNGSKCFLVLRVEGPNVSERLSLHGDRWFLQVWRKQGSCLQPARWKLLLYSKLKELGGDAYISKVETLECQCVRVLNRIPLICKRCFQRRDLLQLRLRKGTPHKYRRLRVWKQRCLLDDEEFLGCLLGRERLHESLSSGHWSVRHLRHLNLALLPRTRTMMSPSLLLSIY